MSSTCMRLSAMLDNRRRCASRVACDVNAEVRVVRSFWCDDEGGGGSDAGGVVVGGEEVEQDELTKFPMMS